MNEHILLVDDDTSILEGFEEILKQNNFSISKAQSEKEAINRLTTHNCTAAIVDLVLGTESGMDLIKTINRISEHTAIIALTGYPSVESAKECLKRGVFEYLQKPCEKNILVDTVQKAIAHKKAERNLRELKKQKETMNNRLSLESEDVGARIRSVYSQMNILIQGADKFSDCASEQTKSEYIHLVKLIALMIQRTLKKYIFNGLRIFVVDDDLLNLNFMNTQLSKLGCTVTLSNRSEEAKEVLKKSSFDLCIIEKNLPILSGLELTQCIRKEISTQMPIIGMVKNDNRDIKDICVNAGMNRFIPKPLDFRQLKLLMIDTILNKKYTSMDTF